PEDFDGHPLRSIYQCDGPLPPIEPVFWDEVDLGAWRPLAYCPVKPYEHQPFSINRPNSRIDLNNLAYNVASIGEISVLRLFDDVLFPLARPDHPLSDGIERHDLAVRHGSPDAAAEAALALDVSNVTLGDYSHTSTGNLMRLSRTIDWLQQRSMHPAGSSPAGGVNAAIDRLQDGLWDVYQFGRRLAVQLLDETLLNGIENGTDRTINAFGRLPAEVIVE
ncbi:MAG: hypothetical protein ACREJB_15555, partial [Planctomycetaceae bacterium]